MVTLITVIVSCHFPIPVDRRGDGAAVGAITGSGSVEGRKVSRPIAREAVNAALGIVICTLCTYDLAVCIDLDREGPLAIHAGDGIGFVELKVAAICGSQEALVGTSDVGVGAHNFSTVVDAAGRSLKSARRVDLNESTIGIAQECVGESVNRGKKTPCVFPMIWPELLMPVTVMLWFPVPLNSVI